jgi:4-hydroxy-4-methyl-2-oxoglutarate aldolase
MRDIRMLRAERFPAFCRGICPRSAQKNTPGSINVPVQVGGLVVSPGDIVIGDDDGVAVIPLAVAEEVLKKARSRMDMEFQQAQDIKDGKKPLEIIYGDAWVDARLEGKVQENR